MKFLIDTLKTFTKFELALWLGSLALIISSFFLTGNDDYLVLTASLVGATALILGFQRKCGGAGPHRRLRRLLRHHFLSFPLLWRDDYLPGYVCAHRRCFRRHVAAPFLQGKGRESQFAEPKGVPRSIRRGTDCFFHLFLYPPGVSYQSPHRQYGFRVDQLSRFLSDDEKERLLCRRLCRKRRRARRFMDPRFLERGPVICRW